MPKQYQCALCHGVFDLVTPEEEQLEEMRENYGDVPPAEQEIVCDDCFEMMVKVSPPRKMY